MAVGPIARTPITQGPGSAEAQRLAVDVLAGSSPESFGAVGYFTAAQALAGYDSTAAIRAAAKHCAENGLALRFQGGMFYKTSGIINPYDNATWMGNGATLVCTTAVAMVGNVYGSNPVTASVTADVAGPTNKLTLSSVTGLAIGDWIGVRLGNNPWDVNEPRYAFMARITAIAGTVITVDHMIPHQIPILSSYTWKGGPGDYANGATVAAATAGNRLVRKLGPAERTFNFTCRDLNLLCPQGSPGVEGGFWFQFGRSIRLTNIGGNVAARGEMGTGLAGIMQFCSDVAIDGVRLDSNVNSRGQASLGRMFNFSNSMDVTIRNVRAKGLQSSAIFAESFCERLLIENIDLEYDTPTTGPYVAVFHAVQGCELLVRNASVRANSQLNLTDIGGTTSTIKFEGRLEWRGTQPLSFNPARKMNCIVDYANPRHASVTGSISGTTLTVTAVADGGILPGAYLTGNGIAPGTRVKEFGNGGTTGMGGTGTYAVSKSQTVASGAIHAGIYFEVDFSDCQSVTFYIPLAANMYNYYELPGPISDIQLATSSGTVVANLGMYIGNELNNGGDYTSSLVAGQMVAPTDDNYSTEGAYFGSGAKWSGRGKLLVFHNATAPAAGSFIGGLARVGRVLRSSHWDPAITAQADAANFQSDGRSSSVGWNDANMKSILGAA